MVMSKKRDYYEVLGLSRDCTESDIKRAYRILARKYHPDVNKDPEAEKICKEINEAYEVLSDPKKKAIYDQYGHAGLDPNLRASSGFGFNDFDFDFGFESIFDAFFGGRGSSRTRDYYAERGSDLRINIEVGFYEAIWGVEKEITISHLEVCSRCKGNGAEPDSKIITCATCHGTGQIQQVQRVLFTTFTQITECPKCNGKGQYPQESCKNCKGKGRVKKDKQLKVKIPAGVDTGARLKISNEGDAGLNGGPAGDLYIVIYVMDDPENIFIRQDNDLFCKIAIDYTQAVLGDEIEVPSLEGNTKIQIAQGTQPGTVIKLKGKGVPYLNNPQKRGDLNIEITLHVPTQVSPEEAKLLKELQNLRKKEKNTGFLNILKNVIGKSSSK